MMIFADLMLDTGPKIRFLFRYIGLPYLMSMLRNQNSVLTKMVNILAQKGCRIAKNGDFQCFMRNIGPWTLDFSEV